MEMRGDEGYGGTVAFEKAPQNFYEGMDWLSLCKSDCSPILVPSLARRRSFASGCGDASALYGERLRPLVGTVRVTAIQFRLFTLTIAPTSNRRRIPPRSRPRTISCGLGRNQIGAQMDLHKPYPSPIPLIKVLAKLLSRSVPFPRSPFPRNPSTVTPLMQQPSGRWCLRAFPDRRRALRDRGTCRNP